MKTGTKASIDPRFDVDDLGHQAVLEHEHQQSEGGPGRQQVEQDRLGRDDERVEGDQQQQERQGQHEAR